MFSKILVANRNNGSRLETYAIPGKAGSRDFYLNGPAAKLGNVGDVVTIMAFAGVEEKDVASHRPTVIVLDENNEIAHRHN